ncbi:hypothetical protein VKT23_016799 [Stygiomarasmius scandens]|uniref:Uncharacterized protein n=1 Tax=Marasmiellus scandens TaxID=2682957 RepID=A0ABR1IX25_9AGAR
MIPCYARLTKEFGGQTMCTLGDAAYLGSREAFLSSSRGVPRRERRCWSGGCVDDRDLVGFKVA